MSQSFIEDVKDGKIRGHEPVARGALTHFYQRKKELDKNCAFISTYLSALQKTKVELLSLPGQHLLDNVIEKVFDKSMYSGSDFQTLKEIEVDLEERIQTMFNKLNSIEKQISTLGARKIKQGFCVYTHGHSETVAWILLEAGKHSSLQVNVSDVLVPLNAFVLTLKNCKIPVSCYPASGMHMAIQKSDIILIGCSKFNKTSAACPFGVEAILKLAKAFSTPIYLCVDTLKYRAEPLSSPAQIPAREIWPDIPPKTPLHAHSEDIVSLCEFNGIICEEGIQSPKDFVKIFNKK